MVIVYVPAGEFLMGSSDAQLKQDTAAGEAFGYLETDCIKLLEGVGPQHTVALDAFWIDKTEVTSARYHTCVEAGACAAPGACFVGLQTYHDATKADHPVVCVGYDQAKAYCERAGARLPTEAEWEKAARGTHGRLYPWGNTFDSSKVNFSDRNCEIRSEYTDLDDGYACTTPVGSFPAGARPYGVLDMAGNVYEWVSDWYDGGYYSRSPDRNPPGPDSGEYHGVRGGSWSDTISAWVRKATRTPAPSAPDGYLEFQDVASPASFP
jgi:formylglycine-generating enzyme required for sulfatase activity